MRFWRSSTNRYWLFDPSSQLSSKFILCCDYLLYWVSYKRVILSPGPKYLAHQTSLALTKWNRNANGRTGVWLVFETQFLVRVLAVVKYRSKQAKSLVDFRCVIDLYSRLACRRWTTVCLKLRNASRSLIEWSTTFCHLHRNSDCSLDWLKLKVNVVHVLMSGWIPPHLFSSGDRNGMMWGAIAVTLGVPMHINQIRRCATSQRFAAGFILPPSPSRTVEALHGGDYC